MYSLFDYFLRSKNIPLTKPLIPNKRLFNMYLNDIFNSRMLTNRSFYVKKLENNLEKFIETESIVLTSNGTSAIESILKTYKLEIQGERDEIIVPAFTFVATVSAIISSGFKPVFVDVIFENGTIDPKKVEELINKKTCAIMGVHIYGNPCKNNELEKIAMQYNLRLFYDASHAFGVKQNGNSILKYGNASAVSFHATKIFTTCEGGGVITNELDKIHLIRNFINHGIQSLYKIKVVGTNSKMSELHAAYGLSVIKKLPKAIKKRKKIYNKYVCFFERMNLDVYPFLDNKSCEHNYIYAPFFFANPHHRDCLHDYLREKNIFVKKYFYPLLTDIDVFKKNFKNYPKLEISQKLSKSILCFPLYDSLSKRDLKSIFFEIDNYFKNKVN